MTASGIGGFATGLGKWSAFLLSVALLRGADIDVSRTLKGVEDRYNHIQTLQVSFSETAVAQGRKRVQSGELFLRKPGKMRWEYKAPAGTLLVSDGKFIYYYNAADNRAEKMKFKETDDMRAPLAFLLGQLNFNNDFREFRAQPDHDNVMITAIPKNDKLPYTEVTFSVSPDFVMHWLRVKGQDGSTVDFTFENEKKNPAIPDAMFKFTPPAGAQYVDSSQ